MKAKCKKCNYEWDTESEMFIVSCPSCGSKVKIRDYKKLPKNQTMKDIKEVI